MFAVIRHYHFNQKDGAEIDRRIHVREARQSLLTQDDPLRLWVVLDEAVFHRLVGGRTVMRRQLARLIERRV